MMEAEFPGLLATCVSVVNPPLLKVIEVVCPTSGDRKSSEKIAVSPIEQIFSVSQLAIPCGIGGMFPVLEASKAKLLLSNQSIPSGDP